MTIKYIDLNTHRFQNYKKWRRLGVSVSDEKQKNGLLQEYWNSSEAKGIWFANIIFLFIFWWNFCVCDKDKHHPDWNTQFFHLFACRHSQQTIETIISSLCIQCDSVQKEKRYCFYLKICNEWSEPINIVLNLIENSFEKTRPIANFNRNVCMHPNGCVVENQCATYKVLAYVVLNI